MNNMTCRICGNSQENSLYRFKEMMYGTREEFDYFQCAKCKCLQIATVPADLSNYYPEGYSGYIPPNDGLYKGIGGFFKKARYKSVTIDKSLFNRMIAAVVPASKYEHLSRFNLTIDSSILDVGCGFGRYLYPLYSFGMKQVMGVDPFVDPITYPNGYRVEKKYIDEVRGQWDLIIYNHAFEHVPDPLDNLKAIEKLLKPTGHCVIRIPTVSSFAWQHYKEHWVQLDAPRHLFIHSRESIRLLAEEANLVLEDIVDDSEDFQFSVSEKYKAGYSMYEVQPGSRSYFEKKKERFINNRKAKQLNKMGQGDQAAFILSKKS
ncbi:class I SAM-dependent methyltransferase [Fibrella aquatica]|uniref:class I SAM-dependent methyltransferase n=1 Tax=Fibrella aquatica TaxID=3242487 RepID=UPI00351FEDB1